MNTFDIQKIKLTLGDIEILDYRNFDIVTAHQRLGKAVSAQATRILEDRIRNLNDIEFERELRFAKRIMQNLEEKSESPKVGKIIQTAIKLYLRCLKSWALGAGFEKYIQKNELSNFVSPEELAILLQNDNTGCQTGIFRRADSSVAMWHTEEDEKTAFGERFDKLRLVIFHLDFDSNSSDIFSFVYPDLLPGAAFNWRSDGYLQSVDSLYLEPDKEAYVLANIVCWLTLVISPYFPAQTILDALKPISDGYALNFLFKKDTMVTAQKIEFARDQYAISILDEKPKSCLFQVNLLSDVASPYLKKYENVSDEEKVEYLKRYQRTLLYISHVSESKNAKGFHRLLTSMEGTPYCYASPWVKSYILAELNKKKLDIWVGSGPALRNDLLHHFSYKFGKTTGSW